jgi:hypothetical protein
MRAIPHRVIVLLGLDAGVFPRQRQRPGFHLLEQQRRLGDPNPADQDRYVLLEALLSARDHLLITWSSRDERSGEPLPPATPVRQWLAWLPAASWSPSGGAELLAASRRQSRWTARQLSSPGGAPPRQLRSPPAAHPRQLRGSTAGVPPPSPLAWSAPRTGARGSAPPARRPPPATPTTICATGCWPPRPSWLARAGTAAPREWAELIDDLRCGSAWRSASGPPCCARPSPLLHLPPMNGWMSRRPGCSAAAAAPCCRPWPAVSWRRACWPSAGAPCRRPWSPWAASASSRPAGRAWRSPCSGAVHPWCWCSPPGCAAATACSCGWICCWRPPPARTPRQACWWPAAPGGSAFRPPCRPPAPTRPAPNWSGCWPCASAGAWALLAGASPDRLGAAGGRRNPGHCHLGGQPPAAG